MAVQTTGEIEGMTRPKDTRTGITFHLSQEELDQIDKLRTEAVAQVPGAKLPRATWVQQVVRRHLEGLRSPPPAKESAAKGRGR